MSKRLQDSILNKDITVKRQNAILLRQFLEAHCLEPSFNYGFYMEKLQKRIYELCKSNDNNSRLSAIILMDELIDLKYQEEERNSRFTYTFRYFLKSANQLCDTVIVERSKVRHFTLLPILRLLVISFE